MDEKRVDSPPVMATRDAFSSRWAFSMSADTILRVRLMVPGPCSRSSFISNSSLPSTSRRMGSMNTQRPSRSFGMPRF